MIWTATPTDPNWVESDDFVPGQEFTGVLTFEAGDTEPQEISLVVQGDLEVEEAENFLVTLSGATNGTIIEGQSMASGTIFNDDTDEPATLIGIAAVDADKAEGDDGTTEYTFDVTRSGVLNEASAVQVLFDPGDANAADFVGGVPETQTVFFLPQRG